MPDQDVAALIDEMKEAAHDSLDAGLLRKGADALERCEAALRDKQVEADTFKQAAKFHAAERAQAVGELERCAKLLAGEKAERARLAEKLWDMNQDALEKRE